MIDHIDHIVLTTANEAACVDFYTRVLGMRLETFVGGTGRFAGASGQSRTVGEGSLITNTGRLATSGTLRY